LDSVSAQCAISLNARFAHGSCWAGDHIRSGAHLPFLQDRSVTSVFCSHRLNIRWRSPSSFIGNLWVSRRVGLIQFEFTARAQVHVPSVELANWSSLVWDRGAENVVTLGMRCCHLLWVSSGRGSRRALRTHSPRILCRCSVLRSQIFGVRRRDVGAKPRGHRRRDRSGAALSQKSALSNRTSRSSDSAVMRVTGPRRDGPKRKA